VGRAAGSCHVDFIWHEAILGPRSGNDYAEIEANLKGAATNSKQGIA